MSFTRKNTLRQSLGMIILPKKLIPIKRDRLKGRYLFRAIVRLTLEYIDWLIEKPVIEDIDEIKIGIKKPREKKERTALSSEDRSRVLMRIIDRTKEDKKYIVNLFKKLHIFTKYSEDIRFSLAGACLYQYLRPGRVIVRQGGKAENLYVIISGEVHLSRIEEDKYTDEIKEINMGTMSQGDMFGEIALLHDIPRTATVVTKTVVELFYLSRDDFDKILKNYLLREWDILQDALIHFNYFKGWDKQMIRECCILSRLKDFQPNETILGDGRGMVNHVHFVLKGQCRLLEHMLIREKRIGTKMQYELYEEHKEENNYPNECEETKILSEKANRVKTERRQSRKAQENKEGGKKVSIDYAEHLLSIRPIGKNVDPERLSVITATVYDVMNEWHEITDVAAKLMREPSVTSQIRYPDDIHTVFMQICTFLRGSCFGLGEEMRNRRIVSTNHVRCFLIPRYWLLEHNRANIWGRVTMFLNDSYPTKEKLFKEFVRNRKWIKYKQDLVCDILRTGRNIRINTTIHDVPYSIRITQGVEPSATSCT